MYIMYSPIGAVSGSHRGCIGAASGSHRGSHRVSYRGLYRDPDIGQSRPPLYGSIERACALSGIIGDSPNQASEWKRRVTPRHVLGF